MLWNIENTQKEEGGIIEQKSGQAEQRARGGDEELDLVKILSHPNTEEN